MPQQKCSDEAPRYRAIAAFILLLAVTAYLIRIIMPINWFIAGFPTISYLLQYLSFFVLGTVAFRRNWFRKIPRSMEKVGFILALVATITLFPLAILSRGTNSFFGSGSRQSAVYARWDSTVAVGMTLWLITLFRERFTWSGSFSRVLHRHSYTVCISKPQSSYSLPLR